MLVLNLALWLQDLLMMHPEAQVMRGPKDQAMIHPEDLDMMYQEELATMHKGDIVMTLREDLDMEDLLMIHKGCLVMMHRDYLAMTSREDLHMECKEDLIMMHQGVVAMIQLQEHQLGHMDKWQLQAMCLMDLEHHLEVVMRHQLEAETTLLGDKHLDNAVEMKSEEYYCRVSFSFS